MGQNSVYQLVYVSAATEHFGAAELGELLDKARIKNSELGISGVLLFRDNSFFQVLEGHQESVQSLYDRIRQDPRHDQTLVLSERTLSDRNFGAWAMGFVNDQFEVDQLPGFVDFFRDRTFVNLQGDTDRIARILDGFSRGRWHRGKSRELKPDARQASKLEGIS